MLHPAAQHVVLAAGGDRHATRSGIRTPNVELGALHRSAPRVRRWTTLSLNKNTQPSSYHIVLSVVSRARCPMCGVPLFSHVSVVPCVLPRLPDSDKKVSLFFFFAMASKSVDTR